jgi:hypothetical protein
MYNKSYHTHTINVIIDLIIDHNNFTACEYNKSYNQSYHTHTINVIINLIIDHDNFHIQ